MSDAPHIPGLGHEHADIRARPIVLAGIGLAVIVVLVTGLMLGFYDALATRAARLSPPPNPLAAAAPRLPPEPRLQVHPVRDLHELREAENTILDHYAWIDRQTGVVRIPIARAIDLLAARAGQPAAPGAAK